MKKWLLLSFLVFTSQILAANPIPNPGFEEGTKGWRFGEEVSKPSPEAAHTGKQGLRVKIDQGRPYGSSTSTSRLPVKPGTDISLTFWAKTNKKMLAVYLFFYDKNNRKVKIEKNKNTGGAPALTVSKADRQWHEYKLKTKVPDKAVAVDAWIHAWSNTTGTVDLDDFEFNGLPADAKPIKVAAKKKKVRKPINKPLPKTPPVIILKLDDMTQRGAKKGQAVSWRWQKLVDILEKENIKANLGIIGKTFEKDNSKFNEWLKEQDKKGYVEFWNHGYTHKELPREGNKRRCEFTASVAEQVATLKKTQQITKEKTGIELQAFGAPFNVTNTDTEKALGEFPEITVWFFGSNKTKTSKKLSLKRIVNLEHPTMNPSASGLISDYDHRGKFEKYLVLQGHPNAWNDKRFEEFTKAIAFLKEKGCKFVTCSEYLAMQNKENK